MSIFKLIGVFYSKGFHVQWQALFILQVKSSLDKGQKNKEERVRCVKATCG